MDWALSGYATPYSKDERFRADGASTRYDFDFKNDKLLRVEGVRLGRILLTRFGVELGNTHLDRIVPFRSVVEKAQEYHDAVSKIGAFDYIAFKQTVIGGAADGREHQQPWQGIMALVKEAIKGHANAIMEALNDDQDVALGQQISDEAMKTFAVLKPEPGYHMQTREWIPVPEANDGLPKPQPGRSIVTMAMANGLPMRGDVVCVLRGCRAPVILRPVGTRYQVIGDAYVYGFMRGEAFEDVERDNLAEFWLC